jgi:hypothetical protein
MTADQNIDRHSVREAFRKARLLRRDRENMNLRARLARITNLLAGGHHSEALRVGLSSAREEASIASWVQEWSGMKGAVDTAWVAKSARAMTTEQLKVLWGLYDGREGFMSEAEVTGEAVHLVLSERGESDFCAR